MHRRVTGGDARDCGGVGGTGRFATLSERRGRASRERSRLGVYHDVGDCRDGASHAILDGRRPTVRIRERARTAEDEREEYHDALVRADEAQLARIGSGLLPDDGLDRSRIDVDLLGSRRLAKRFEVRLDALDLRDLRANRSLDLLGDVVRLVEGKIARQLEVEGDLDVPVDVEDLEVV